MSSIWVRTSHICGGATGSHMTGRGPARNRKYAMHMRNRKFRNTKGVDADVVENTPTNILYY
jgi:hypothetical protein